MARARKASAMAATLTSTAAVRLKTNRPVVQFLHMDGSHAESSNRAVRLYNGQLCVERRRRLLPITVTGATTATCRLDAEPLAQGYADAQAIAPVCNYAQLGIEKKTPPKADRSETAAKQLAAALKGQSKEVVMAYLTKVLEQAAK